MKKVKLKLKYDELGAIYADLFNSVKISTVMKFYEHRLLYASLTELYMKIAPKMMFKTDKKISLTLSVPHACALFIHVKNHNRNAAIYLDNVYIRISNQIDQQLA